MSELVMTLEAVIFAVRLVSVTKRRLISQSPKVRSVATVAPVLTAAASVAHAPLPEGPVAGVAAVTIPADVNSSALPRARPPTRAVRRDFIRLLLVLVGGGYSPPDGPASAPEREPLMPFSRLLRSSSGLSSASAVAAGA